tara:strand:- start:439 stop:561 length:123 start_codon:yes stop_codon:yes gene_type:complete
MTKGVMNLESINRSPAFTGLSEIAGKSVAGYGWASWRVFS